MKDSRRSGRRPGKEVVVERDNDDKYIDVNDEPSDDDFVDLGRNSAYALGLRRSGRNKDKEVYDSDHAKTVASGSKCKILCRLVFSNHLYNWKDRETRKKKIKGNKYVKAENNVVNDKTLKPNQKAGLEEIGFGGMVEFKVDGIPSKLGLYVVDNFDENKMEIMLYKGSIVFTKDMIGGMLGLKNEGLDILEGNPNRDDEMMCYVDGTKCNDNIVCRIRPPTKVWTAELLSEREAEELNCGGFGYGELEEDFVEEEGDPIPNNIEFEVYMGWVEALNEVGFRVQRNEEVEDGVSDIGVNEQTQENMCRVLTQKAFESVADEVERSIEKTKIMEIDDRPSFSFGVTQDFDVIPVTDNEKKVLTPMPISAYTPEGEARDVFMFNGKRVTSKSNIMRSPFYSRVADLDVALSSEESKVTKYLFLTSHDSYTDILFKSKSGQQSDRLQMESMGKDYVETNILDTWVVVCNYMEEYRSNDSPFRLFLSTFVVVFLPIDNEGHRFLLSFDLKYEAVTMFDQKKDKILKKSKLRKGAKIGNNIVAEMLINFGRYLYGLDHIKSRNIITPELEIVEYDWQTAMNDATILMSDCNVLKEQVKAHMDHASGSMLSDVHLNKGQVKIK
ncbi:hypothetical protein Tco_0644193 [Tanacetum coccineum]